MSPAVKILDKRPKEGHRHNLVYQTFGTLGVYVKKVHDGKGVFYAIANEDQLEKILSDESKAAFHRAGFEIVPPLEFNSLKTVIAKNVDYMLDSYSDEEVIDSIERHNDWAQVEHIYRIPAASKLLKIRFKTQQMAQNALDKGLIILQQSIPKWNLEKEIFIKLTPCRNCFRYDHKSAECTVEKKDRCTFCAGNHRQFDCNAEAPCCINCGGAHRTLAATCKVRKDLIKKRSEDVRSRAKTNKQWSSYASATSATPNLSTGMTNPNLPGLTKDETKDMMTTIMSAIVYSHYVESLTPGTFQQNMKEMFRLNGLKPVNFPTPPMNDVVIQACKDAFGTNKQTTDNDRQTNEQDIQTPSTSEYRQTETDDLSTHNSDLAHTKDESHKRMRQSLTPPIRNDKRPKKDGEFIPPKSPKTTKKQTNKNEGLPQRELGARGGRRREAGEGGQSSRDSSASSAEGNRTREIGLTVIVRKSSNLKINSKDPRDRNQIRLAVLREQAKFTWRNVKVEWRNIMNAFEKETLDLNDIHYQALDDEQYNGVISKWDGYSNEH